MFNNIAHGPAHKDFYMEDIPDSVLVENLNKVVLAVK